MAPKRPLPSDTPGGRGGPLNERGCSLWGTLFECLFFNAFSDALFEASDSILEVPGFNVGHFGICFAVFSYLGSFLKIALSCGRELKNQGPGVTEIGQKSNKTYIWLWNCFRKQVFKDTIQFWLKNCSKREPQLEPKLARRAVRTPYFHPWVDKVAQVVPNGAQSGSKGAQRLPK